MAEISVNHYLHNLDDDKSNPNDINPPNDKLTTYGPQELHKGA